MRTQIAAANWKMNLTLQQGRALIDDVVSEAIIVTPEKKVVFAVPFPYLRLVRKRLKTKPQFEVAAQNCHHKKSGAFTGEVSAEMLKSIGANYVIIGHSERREYFRENEEMLAEKLNLALENDLIPIFCCGEPLPVREAGEQNTYVARQLRESLFHLTALQALKLVIAYEPIWAIGTGKTATADQAQEMHAYLRSVLADHFGKQIADSIPILYGGSVKAANATEIFSKPDVDGGLVGGASLDAKEFVSIIHSLK